jgi:hypothetical protein
MTAGQRDKIRREKARKVIDARKKRRKALVEHLLKSV